MAYLSGKVFFARMPSSAHILLYGKIGISGFESKTPWTQTKCSAKLSYIPITAFRRFLHYLSSCSRTTGIFVSKTIGGVLQWSFWRTTRTCAKNCPCWIRTSDCSSQSAGPYRLANGHYCGDCNLRNCDIFFLPFN